MKEIGSDKKFGTASSVLQKYLANATKHIDFEKEVQLFEKRDISTTKYVRLFRVNRASQTEEKSIPQTKKLLYELNMLIIEVEDAQQFVSDSYERDIKQISMAFSAHMKSKIQLLQSSLTQLQDRIHAAYRSKMANLISTTWREYEIIRAAEVKKLESKYSKIMAGQKKKTNEIKRKTLKTEALNARYKAFIEKATGLARRAGVEQEALSNEDKLQMENLEHLQKTLQAKDDLITALRERQNQPEDMNSPRQSPKSESWTRKATPSQQEGLQILKVDESEVKGVQENLVAIPCQDMTMDELVNNFEKQKREELMISHDLEKKYKNQYEMITAETKKALAEFKNVPMPNFAQVYIP